MVNAVFISSPLAAPGSLLRASASRQPEFQCSRGEDPGSGPRPTRRGKPRLEPSAPLAYTRRPHGRQACSRRDFVDAILTRGVWIGFGNLFRELVGAVYAPALRIAQEKALSGRVAGEILAGLRCADVARNALYDSRMPPLSAVFSPSVNLPSTCMSFARSERPSRGRTRRTRQ